MIQNHKPVFNRVIYNTLIERYQLDFVFTYVDALYFEVKSFENASLDEAQRIVGLFNDSEFRTFWNDRKQKERNEILSSLPVSYNIDITEIIQTISKKSEMLLIYDFIREFYEYPVPTNLIGMLDAYKIYLDCKNVEIRQEAPKPFRPILDAEPTWDHEEQAKYMSKIYGKRHTYIIDLVYFGNIQDEIQKKRDKAEICYLFLININTRKLYVIPINFSYNPILRGYRSFGKPKEVTAGEVLGKLIELLTKENIPLRHLISDADRRFTSKAFQEFLENYGIDHKIQQINSGYPVHSLISILNRVVKTIRRWVLWNRLDFYPETIQNLVDFYNDREHKGLSELIGKPVSPNIVDSNYVYENILVYNIQKQNLLTSSRPGYYLRPGDKVRIRKFDKEENPIGHSGVSKYFAGTWTVQGYVDRLILVTYADYAFLVPRWMLVKVNG